MQVLPKLRRRDADTTSYVADYLTRSVRRASGFVLVGNPDIGCELKPPCASRVFQPLLQRGYAESFMRAGNSRFPLNGPPSPSREFSFALHQIQQAIEPHLSLQKTLYSWNQIARKSRATGYFNWRNGMVDILSPWSRSP